jgi:hypothetical protein
MNKSNKSKLTCVSGYWKIKNKHGNRFDNWFKNTLKINCPYIFFGDRESIESVKKYRSKLPTYYIELNIEEFITYKYIDKMRIDSVHCPSQELNLIWNEKIFMLQRALQINPFSSDFFCWIDAGICIYRDKNPPTSPFPNTNKLKNLPKNKFIYSSSLCYNNNFTQKKKNYHLHHHISGTSYILHKNIIDNFTTLYKEYLEKLVDKNNIWTDQVVWTFIFKDNPDKFFKLCDGYGKIINYLL